MRPARFEEQFKKLTEIGSVARGKSKHRPRNDPALYGGAYPFIQTGDVKHSNFYLAAYSQTYNEKGLAQSKLWQPGTLCITIAANIADTAILKIPACFPDSIIGFTAKPEVSDVRFVKYCLDSYKGQMQAISQGTTQDNMSLEKLLSIRFRVPSYDTQKKIAAILSAYDDLIENNRRRIALLEKMAKEIYREWFVRMRFPGHEQAKFEKGVPVGWEVKRVAELVVRKKFGRIYRETELLLTGGVVVIDQSRNEYLGFYDGKPEHVASPESPLILFGDHSCKMQLMFEPFSLAENVIPFAGKNGIPPVFLFYLVHSLVETTEYKRHWTDLVTKEIYVPTSELRTLFDKQVRALIVQTKQLKVVGQQLTRMRDALLPRLISGKLAVEDLDIRFPPSMEEETAHEA